MTKLFRHKIPEIESYSKRILTLGSFDGLHLGHVELIEKLSNLKAESKDSCSIVSSFYPHPRKVLTPSLSQKAISTFRDDLEFLDRFGVDFYFLLNFNQRLALLEAGDFLQKYIIDLLNVDILVLGEDARIGKDRKGDPAFIKDFMQASQREAIICSFRKDAGEKISSGSIRDAISNGDCQRAGKLLGRPYRVTSRIRTDSKRGGALGFPTANQQPKSLIWPKFGVYITRTMVGDKSYMSATNVGIRPTFGGDKPLIETHLLTDDNLDLYARVISVEFLDRIRDEVKFDNPELLKEQIAKDIQAVKNFKPKEKWMK